MTRPEFQTLLTQIREAQDKLLTEKGADYTQQSDDVHHNFKIVAEQVGTECEHCHKHTKLSPLAVWGVYAAKHWMALGSYLTKGSVSSEPIESRFRDLGNYLLLGEGLLPAGQGDGDDCLDWGARCDDESPSGDYCCTRPTAHAGDHVACVSERGNPNGHFVETWE